MAAATAVFTKTSFLFHAKVSSSAVCSLPAAIFCCSRRHESTTNLAAYKRGRGGRSSFSGIVATVIGSSGFLGRYVVNKLGKIGSQVIIPYRGDGYKVRDLKLAGDLGQVLFLPFDVRDEASIRKCMKYSNVVINLMGRDFETSNFTFDDVHVKAAADIARIARESGVERLIHFSHMNAQPDPPSFYVKGGSQYLKSKFRGEEAVRNEFPDATIFRPADIYGPEDRFINYYRSFYRRFFNTVPLWKRGKSTVKAPVFCSDVAEGVINSLYEPTAPGKIYECMGPSRYYLSEIVDFFYRCMRYDDHRCFWVTPLFTARVRAMGLISPRRMNMDKFDREHVSDISQDHDNLRDLGVQLTRMEDRVPYELKPWRRYSFHEVDVGELAPPLPPRPLI